MHLELGKHAWNESASSFGKISFLGCDIFCVPWVQVSWERVCVCACTGVKGKQWMCHYSALTLQRNRRLFWLEAKGLLKTRDPALLLWVAASCLHVPESFNPKHGSSRSWEYLQLSKNWESDAKDWSPMNIHMFNLLEFKWKLLWSHKYLSHAHFPFIFSHHILAVQTSLEISSCSNSCSLINVQQVTLCSPLQHASRSCVWHQVCWPSTQAWLAPSVNSHTQKQITGAKLIKPGKQKQHHATSMWSITAKQTIE